TGSVFSFELPFDTTDLQHEHTIVKADGNKLFSLAGINVLLVEDNKINQMIANKFLDRWKCTTDVASNGFQALSMIVKKKYNIVLMDLQMPDLDGYETSIRIRKMDDDYYRNIPIVALTASAFNEVKEGVMRAGMTDILNKPFIPDELNQKIYFYTRQ
ncbi:MAG: hybrid sensor histidine kinase/response regulator, partial [Bacteroidetes bacterium HGW-Bacteroidetes-22]